MAEKTPFGHGTAGQGNPFVLWGTAGALDSAPDMVTIATPAVQRARTVLDEYLLSKEDRPGGVAVIVGEHGSGRTHILIDALGRALRRLPHPANAVYVNAPSGGFLDLYRMLIGELTHAGVRDRVLGLYTDVVADHFAAIAITRELGARLRSGQYDVLRLVADLKLPHTTFLETLRQRLQKITRNDDFSIVLPLLLREGFEVAASEWLAGHSTDELLRERQVGRSIDDETAAVAAISAIFRLYAADGQRFLLFIDDMERTISSAGRRPDTADHMRQLMQVVSETGAYLICSALPEGLHSLEPRLLNRIGDIIRTTPFTVVDAQMYVASVFRRRTAEEGTGPFTGEIIASLTDLSEGSPQRLVQFLHYAYQEYMTAGTLNEAMVRRVIRDRFEFVTMQNADAEIRRILSAHAWNYRHRHTFGGRLHPPVDYWIPGGAGCALLISESVLTRDDALWLAHRADVIRTMASGVETAVVVIGHLARSAAEELSAAFSAEPIVYTSQGFAEALHAMLSRLSNRTDHSAGRAGEPRPSVIAPSRWEIVMGDKYEVPGQAGAVGRFAHAHDMTLQQAWRRHADEIDLPALARELEVLRRELRRQASTREHDVAVAEVGAAAEAAEHGDGPEALSRLRRAGQWALGAATATGAGVAAAAIRTAMGL
jgi:hypothetical protein